MSSLCVNCGYSVTEPICAECIINEVKVWLDEKTFKKFTAKEISSKFRSLLSRIELLDYVSSPSEDSWNLSTMKCIRCKKEMHRMCYYCVTNQVSQIVQSNLRNKGFLENFHEYFSTDIHDYELKKEINPFLS